MSDEETGYSIRIDEEIHGLDATIEKLDAAEQSTTKVQDELGKLGTGMKRASEASEHAARGHAKHGKEVEHLTGVFHRLVEAGLDPFLHKIKEIAEFEFIRRGVDALIDAPGELIEKLKELGEEVILTAAKAERMDQSFKLTLGQEGAEEVLGWIERISNKTEFTDNQLKGWASELLRAGVQIKDVDKFLAAGLDTAAKSTDKLGGMSRAIEALTRAQITGKVSGRSLLGLSIGVDELKTLPEFKGMSDKQVRKQLEQGTISKDDLLSLIAGKGGVLGDLGLVAGKTFEAQLKNVKEIPEQIYQGLYKTAGFQHLGDFLGSIYETLGPETETGRKAQEALAEGLEYLSEKLRSIDLDVVASKVGDALGALPVAIETASDLFAMLGHGIEFLSSAVGVLSDGISAAAKVLDPFGFFRSTKKDENAEFTRSRDPAEVQFEREQREKLRSAREARGRGEVYVDPELALHPGEDALTRARRRKDEIRKEQREAGKAGGDGLKDGAEGSNPRLAAAGAGMGDALKRGTNESLEIHSPSKALFRAGAFAGDGFVDGIESRHSAIEDAMDAAFTAPAGAGQAAAAAGGAPVITIDVGGITVTVPAGADGHEMGAAIAAALHQMLPGALVGALDGVRAEAGS